MTPVATIGTGPRTECRQDDAEAHDEEEHRVAPEDAAETSAIQRGPTGHLADDPQRTDSRPDHQSGSEPDRRVAASGSHDCDGGHDACDEDDEQQPRRDAVARRTVDRGADANAE